MMCEWCGAMNNRIEQWLPIPGYVGLYEVSNKGSVRSLISGGKTLKPTNNGNGYFGVILWNKKASPMRRRYHIHKLVCMAFLGEAKPGNVVNHKDHNKQNNSVENLEWCSQRQNVLHSAHLMRHEKSIHKQSNSGEKYIYIDTKGRYRVHVGQHDKRFRSFSDAIKNRNEVLLLV